MINIESINYSLRNLKHRKARSFLTVFSILVGISVIFIFISFGYGLYNYTEELSSGSSADKLIIMAKGGGIPGMDDTFKLTDQDVKVIERADGVYEATALYYEAVDNYVAKIDHSLDKAKYDISKIFHQLTKQEQNLVLSRTKNGSYKFNLAFRKGVIL
jgi:ABC-type antimicrobial peptide transport system permease subunit